MQSRKAIEMIRYTSLALVVLPLLFLVGCGPRSDRQSVSGAVSLNGAPLDNGTIRFTSQGGATLQATGAMVQAGSYLIPAEKGLLPGIYHVEISSPDAKAKPIMAQAYAGGPSIPVAPDRIPPEYNSKSDKTIEVTLDGDNEFDFDIASQSIK